MEWLARRLWAGELGRWGGALSVVTAPLSWAWGGALRVRERRLARSGGTRVEGVFVVSVGNLAVGGTGKTPIAAWAAELLERGGVPTTVVVGGAGQDEALLHQRWKPARPVIVARDRVQGVARARDAGARVVVLDDGFQHRRLRRDVDLVLLSADDPFPGALLPRGPYREPASALARADVVLVTRRSADAATARTLAARAEEHAPGAVVAGLRLLGTGWRRLDGGPGAPPAGPVLAACGIARPDAFRRAVEGLMGSGVELLAFEDHHRYTRADARKLRVRAAGRPIVVTEKDAVKLEALGGDLGDLYALVEEPLWEWGEDRVAALLAAGARRAVVA